MSWIICDLDGTLCDDSMRVEYARQREWESYHKGIPNDKPCEAILFLIRCMQETGHKIALITGRPAQHFDPTVRWLDKHKVPFNELQMRPNGDRRTTTVVKPALAKNIGLTPYNTLFVLEDRDEMTKVWRNLGYTCLQVKEGVY